MARILIASASEQSREQLKELLVSSGFSVFRCCGDISELRRTVNGCEDGIILMMGRLPGCRVDDLQWDVGSRIHILLVGKPELLETIENPAIFRLALPASGQAVVGAVQMLTQLHQMLLPRRVGADKDLVERAKALMMQKTGLSENEVHRAMQQYAMRHGIKMTDHAAQILSGSADTEE